MEKLEIKTPCKINLGLKVINKRSDGYHNIETIFYPINLFDKIILESSDRLSFDTNNSLVKSESSNTVLTAVRMLEEHTGKKFDTKIYLEKNIPIGAGLGGGSSDGAIALIGLNNLFNLGLTEKELKKIALEIGSDTPFFINPGVCFAESRGEVLKPIELKINYPILIVNPGIHVSTKWAYESLSVQSDANIHLDYNFLFSTDWNKIRNHLTNDFEDPVFKKYPEIKDIKEKLYESGALFSLMTGSGSTVFGIFPDILSAKKAKLKYPENYFSFIHQ